MLMARPCTLYFSNLRKFIDEAKDYLSATFVQKGFELLQNVCSDLSVHDLCHTLASSDSYNTSY